MDGALYKLPEKAGRVKFGLIILIIVIIGLFFSLVAATQYVASSMQFSELLGEPIVGRIYNPFLFIIWEYNSWDFFRTPGALVKGLVLFVLSPDWKCDNSAFLSPFIYSATFLNS